MGTKRDRSVIVQEEVGARLREARRAAKLSQEEVGRRLGMSRAGYGHLEDGTRAMTLGDLVKLAQIVGHSPSFLLGLDIELTPEEDQLLSAYRAIDTERQRRLIVDLAMLAARPEEDLPPKPPARSVGRPRKPRPTVDGEAAEAEAA